MACMSPVLWALIGILGLKIRYDFMLRAYGVSSFYAGYKIEDS